MSVYSFLSKEQIEMSELIGTRGKKTEATDFSIFLGGSAGNTRERDKKYGKYWTKTDYDSSTIYSVDEWGKTDTIGIDDRGCGIRPVIPISYIIENYPDIEVNEDGIIEFGQYPQSVASVELQDELENAFEEGNLEKTGNTYTTDSQSIYIGERRGADSSFKPQVHEEIEYKGKRYIRVKVNDSENIDNTVSNGEEYEEGDYVWVEVEPVRWIMDEQLGLFISEKILIAGLQYQEKKNISESTEQNTDNIGKLFREKLQSRFSGIDFDESHIKHFMDEYLSRDIEQSMTRVKSKEPASKHDGTYHASDAERYTDEGITTYDKIGAMYQRHLTKEKEIEENENDK